MMRMRLLLAFEVITCVLGDARYYHYRHEGGGNTLI